MLLHSCALVLITSMALIVAPSSVIRQVDAVGEFGGGPHLAPPQYQLATPLAISAPSPCPSNDNVLSNAGFESGTDEWYINGSVATTSTETHEGATAIRLGGDDAEVYMDRRVSPLYPGATYTLSGWGKLSSSGEAARIGVLFYGSDRERLRAEEPAPLTFASTSFVEQSLTFSLSEQVAELYVYLAKDAGTAQFFADALSLTVCEPPVHAAVTPAATPIPRTQAPTALTESAATPATIAVVATPVASPTSTPTVAAANPTPDRSGCDPAYPEARTCIPFGPPFSQGCAITEERNFVVLPPDPQGLDRDQDGIGCEPIPQ